jgi:hypothetical protein
MFNTIGLKVTFPQKAVPLVHAKLTEPRPNDPITLMATALSASDQNWFGCSQVFILFTYYYFFPIPFLYQFS